MHFASFVSFAALVAPVFSLAISQPAAGLASLDKREVQRAAAARIALAKARAARKAKRSTETVDSIVERSLESSGLHKRQLPRQRCSVRDQGSAAAASAFCVSFYQQRGITYSSNAQPACYDTDGNGAVDLCQIRCPAGTTTVGTDTSVNCIANSGTCPGPNGTTQVCPLDPNGVSSCIPNNGGCSFQCVNRGYFKNPRKPTECVNTEVQANNCGRVGNRCPRAYNGNRNYAPACVKSKCTLACPRGFSAYTVSGSTLMNCRPN